MKKGLCSFILLAAMLLCLCSCGTGNGDSYFKIHFIDVGQGDSALVECDGHYMLIDGGDTSAGEKVYEVLKDENVQQLDILAISHLHKDHYGGLIKALTYATQIDLTISNETSTDEDSKWFAAFEHQLSINGSAITVPTYGDKYELGSAIVEVVDVCAEKNNDSLVLLITYGSTTFLFTGDMEQHQERRICERYHDEVWNVTLLKVAHHGSDTSTSIRFLSMVMPQYAVISVSQNQDHPSQQTLDRLEQARVRKIYRTDMNGTIIVKSYGKRISVEPSKK